MSDIKLFRTSVHKVEELQGRSATIEKSLQAKIERHMEEFLGVRFLASEYSTGKEHGGRIDRSRNKMLEARQAVRVETACNRVTEALRI